MGCDSVDLDTAAKFKARLKERFRENSGIDIKTHEEVMEMFKSRGYDLTELEGILTETRSKALVISCAGSGKTTTLLLKLAYDILTGKLALTDTVVVITFLQTGTADISKRWIALCNDLMLPTVMLSRIRIQTIHSFMNGILRQVGIRSKVLSDFESKSIFNECLKSVYPRKFFTVDQYIGFQSVYTKMVNNMEVMEGHVTDFGDYLKSIGFSEVDYARIVAQEDYMESVQKLERVFNLYYTKKLRSTTETLIDFDDMAMLLYFGLRVNEKLREHVKTFATHYYIDEFQDTSEIQYQILKYFWTDKTKVMFIGDDDQAIYSWRGSNINIMTQKVMEDYNPAQHFLSVNYRCSRNIVESVLSSISENSNRYAKSIVAHREGGRVNMVFTENNEFERAKAVLKIIKDNPIGNWGVLARTNRDLALLAILMSRQGLDFCITGKKMNIREDNLFVDVIDMFKACYLNSKSSQFKILNKFCTNYNERQRLNDMFNIMKSSNRSLANFDMAQINRSIFSVSSLVDFMVKGKFDNLCGYYLRNAKGVTDILTPKIVGYANFVKELLNEADGNYQEVLDILNLEVSRVNSYLGNESKIWLTTVHEAKGKQWDNVVIYNDTNSNFPYFRSEEDPEALEEERRIHYIAWTRAIHNLYITTVPGLEGQFLKECSLGRGDVQVINLTNPGLKVF